MKKCILILLMAVPAASMAQKMDFDALYKKYNAREDYYTVEIDGNLINSFGSGSVSASSAKGLSEALSGIESIYVVVSEKRSDSFREDVKKICENTDFGLMANVNEGGEELKFYYKEKSGENSAEFLMIMLGKKEDVALKIVGEIDIKKISNLSRLGLPGFGKPDGTDIGEEDGDTEW